MKKWPAAGWISGAGEGATAEEQGAARVQCGRDAKFTCGICKTALAAKSDKWQQHVLADSAKPRSCRLMPSEAKAEVIAYQASRPKRKRKGGEELGGAE